MEWKQQKNESTDTFIRKKRVLFNQLKSIPSETQQIDILFGMLHSSIREKVLRHNIKTFDELLANAREAELTLAEKCASVNTVVQSNNGPVRCTYCRKKGHTIDKCFKKQNNEQPIIIRDKPIIEKSGLSCYGCNTPGYVRSNCPKCTNKRNCTIGVENFNSICLSPAIGSDIPTVNVLLFGVPGQAYFDTAARISVASSNLKRIMDMQNCKYNRIECEVTLADGSSSMQKCLSTVCKILVGGRSLDIQFMILPNADRNRTLLGVDFLERAGITINLGQKYWNFEDEPENKIDFVEPWPLKLNLIEIIHTVDISKRKPTQILQHNPKQYCQDEVYQSEFENYGPDIVDSRYDPHAIQKIFQDCLPIGMTTPKPHPQSHLFTGMKYVGKKYKKKVEVNMIEFKILKDTDAIQLSPNQKQILENLLVEHDEIFGRSDEPCPYAEHAINTGERLPISSPPYRLSFNKSLELKSEIEKLLEIGIIEECESAWTSPVVMVPKKGGGMRLCIDYRKINAITIPDKYPLPRMDDLLHAAKSTQFMTTFDLQRGYYQIKIKLSDVDKTCCTTLGYTDSLGCLSV